jgi:hypothetical protein
METTHVDEIGSGPDHVLDYLSYLPIFSVEGNVGAGSKPVLLQFRSQEYFSSNCQPAGLLSIYSRRIFKSSLPNPLTFSYDLCDLEPGMGGFRTRPYT